MELIKFLRSHKDWQIAKALLESDAYGVDVREHEDGRTLFKYNQFAANMDEPLVLECRGIILDRFNDWAVVSYPFNRFFHHNQERAAEIDWSTAEAWEKLDGSCCTLYFWKGSWRVQTNKQIEADHVMQDNFGDGSPNAGGLTFTDKFWEIFNKKYNKIHLNRNFCYMFELCTKLNKVVTEYDDDRLVLIGVRIVQVPYTERSIHYFSDWFDIPDCCTISCPEDIPVVMEGFANETGDHEGFVICDAHFNRVKVKSAEWSEKFYERYQKTGAIVASRANLVECILQGDHPEFLSVHPEFKEVVDDYIDQLDAFSKYIEEEYENLKCIEDQKEFALAIEGHPFKSFLFAKRNRDISVKKSLQDKSGKSVLDILNRFRSCK
jgi:hypothetical protein